MRGLGSTTLDLYLFLLGRANRPPVEGGDNPVDLGLLEALTAWVTRRIHVQMDRVRFVQLFNFPALLPDKGHRGSLRSCLNRLVDKEAYVGAINGAVLRMVWLRKRGINKEMQKPAPSSVVVCMRGLGSAATYQATNPARL
jgi:hypothetical protein